METHLAAVHGGGLKHGQKMEEDGTDRFERADTHAHTHQEETDREAVEGETLPAPVASERGRKHLTPHFFQLPIRIR